MIPTHQAIQINTQFSKKRLRSRDNIYDGEELNSEGGDIIIKTILANQWHLFNRIAYQ